MGCWVPLGAAHPCIALQLLLARAAKVTHANRAQPERGYIHKVCEHKEKSYDARPKNNALSSIADCKQRPALALKGAGSLKKECGVAQQGRERKTDCRDEGEQSAQELANELSCGNPSHPPSRHTMLPFEKTRAT